MTVAVPGRLPRGGRQGHWLLLGQVLSSGSNFALTMAVLRETSAAGFGAFSLVQVGYQLLLVIARSALAEPVLAGGASRLAFNLPRLMAALGLLVGVAIFPLTFLVGEELRGVATVMVLALPVLLAQEGYRQERVCAKQAGHVVALEALWIAGMATTLAAGLFVSKLSFDPTVATAAWVAGAILSACWGLATSFNRVRPPLSQTWAVVRRSLKDLLVVAVLMRGARQASVLALSATLGLAEFGTLRSAIALMTPTSVILQAARSRAFQIGKSRASATRSIYGSIAAICTAWLGGMLVLSAMKIGIPAKVPTLTLAIVGASFLARVGGASAEVSLLVRERYADLRRAVVRTLPLVLGLPALAGMVLGRDGAAVALVVIAVLTWAVLARASSRTVANAPDTVVTRTLRHESEAA